MCVDKFPAPHSPPLSYPPPCSWLSKLGLLKSLLVDSAPMKRPGVDVRGGGREGEGLLV